ncbi:SHOCT domain-containing protein [Domibacillus robiginosus]|uniref:SHOCT domain-containing protein n=1 Tax=Domibacillus robiginosus TaxID=1071054 RepID=UPI00067D78F0|nr:SHOCT domain-containing protein [Domibacillus robiginosus]
MMDGMMGGTNGMMGGMMDSSMMWMCILMLVGLLLLAAIIGTIIYTIARRLMSKSSVTDRPLMLLKERFVKGEISEEEYTQKRKVLTNK